ncbi:MAG: 7-carboxy-7-deazaguanine synthase QueE [Gemmataceae bacterium]|nr:7-carboxy-7-deazaguanine synthase QueE [Gemmataceae bacterium]MCS7272212.1 7-carboxy-7-deazaguanine synthase QueE [Gemmataceae bacterium]MDW8244335.1 radical SAM protein [Thermogemmata sp.]
MSERVTRALGLAQVPAEAEHRIRLLRQLQPGELLIHEIYRSIQGESTFAGLPCVFIRLAVCDLRCVWCDTPHAFAQGEIRPRVEVVRQALSYGCPLVEVTGGEPLLQPEVYPLMQELADAGVTVLLETSGAHDVSAVDPRVHIIMDLKCPDSGECARNWWPNLQHLKPSDQIKFVIASRRDWEWTVHTIRHYDLQERFTCLVSPAFGRITPLEIVTWLLESGLQKVRFQLQLHKYVWDPTARGV